MNTAFKKDTAGLRDGNGFISLKAMQSIDTARFRRANKAVNLRKQAVITKCRGNIKAELSRVFEKAVDFRA